MNISKLHIFAKNTDATASLKGYHYQVLKTLETLIDNYIEQKEDEIYCDFEEDIFQKNEIDGTTKFRQIKLYSRNFSFRSLFLRSNWFSRSSIDFFEEGENLVSLRTFLNNKV